MCCVFQSNTMTTTGGNDNTTRGYPLRMTITTRQVTDVVMYDEDILAVKGGRRVKEHGSSLDDETRREDARLVALRYLLSMTLRSLTRLGQLPCVYRCRNQRLPHCM